tara:strand:+ start:46 stop:483 length:438 start_codon:yes stop_codon:yes gene_type:complete
MVNIEQKRECGECTMCCEGHLAGEVYGKKIAKNTPCHFVTLNKGCNIYKDRPQDPCKNYKCAWITDKEIPYWMKPNVVDAIIDWRKTRKGEGYLHVVEGKNPLTIEVLHWVITYCLSKKYNLFYYYKGINYQIGNKNFVDEFNIE